MIQISDLDGYDGNEHMAVKHALLESYLERLLMIIGQGRAKKIAFIDGYAGPWKAAGGDLSKTSFARAHQIMTACRAALLSRNFRVEIRALFIEKNRASQQVLRCWAIENGSDEVPVETINSDFVDAIPGIVNWLHPDEFAFVLIDPTGMAPTPTQLQPLLVRPNTELLINVMWNFIQRFRGHSAFVPICTDFFGEGYTTEFVDQPQARARVVMDRLAVRIRQTGQVRDRAVLRCARFPVEYVNSQQRVRYYLFFVSGSDKGLLVFLDECEKQLKAQKRIKYLVEERATGIGDLFASTHTDFACDPQHARQAWLMALPHPGSTIKANNRLLAKLTEESGSLICEVQQAFAELAQEGKLAVDDVTKLRPKKPVHFDEDETVRRLR